MRQKLSLSLTHTHTHTHTQDGPGRPAASPSASPAAKKKDTKVTPEKMKPSDAGTSTVDSVDEVRVALHPTDSEGREHNTKKTKDLCNPHP